MAASDDIAQTLLPAVDQTRLGGETPPPAERQIDRTQFGGSAPSGAAGPGAADAAVTSSAGVDTMQQTQFGAGLAAAQKDVADPQQLAATQLAGRGTAEGIDQTRLGGGGGGGVEVDQTQFGGGAPARELVGVGDVIIFVLCLWFLVVGFFSLPVATWESIRPLTQAELGNIIFDPLTAKDQDLFLQFVRRDLFLFVSSMAVLSLCCFLVVEYPTLSRALLFLAIGISLYFYVMTELLLNKFSNNPRRTMFYGPQEASAFIPGAFLETKIVRTWFDFTRFGLFAFFFTTGALFGDHNRSASAGPHNILATGRTYGYVSDGLEDYYDGTQFRFSRNSEVDTLRSVGYRENGRTFCVAPILEQAEEKTELYMWAVGQDCCLSRGEFWCTAERGYDLLDTTEAREKSWHQASLGRQAVRAVVPDTEAMGYLRGVRTAVAAYALQPITDEAMIKFVFWSKNSEEVINQLSARSGKFLATILFAVGLPLALLLALAPGAGIVRKIRVSNRVERRAEAGRAGGGAGTLGRLDLRRG
eukprot:g7812.t1